MRNRGSAVPEQCVAPGAILAATRHEWEAREHGWSGPVVTVAEDWVVAADASLYYLADLRRRLSHHYTVDRRAPYGELLIAALRAWGDRFAQYLEGDYAIIAWHRASGRVLLARDFVGKRPLAMTITADHSLVVASSPLAVVQYPGVSHSYDLDFIATSISGLLGHGYGTAFEDVGVVPGGATMAFEAGHLVTVDRWSPPPFSSDWEEQVSDRAAETLRGLVEDAVVERFPASGVASVWMSGGWDSTSIFASGRTAFDRSKSRVLLRPISMKYPEGDTGDETPFVEAVAQRWNADVQWAPVQGMPLFEDADRRASIRDDPRVHPFESQIRALCRVSREIGARIVADGAGGDHLFMVSSASIMADHLRAGRFGILWESWKTWGRRQPRLFARTCLLPQLSRETVLWIGSVRGRPLRGFWDAEIPAWVRATPALLRQVGPEYDRDPNEGIAAWETRGLLGTPFLPRALSWTHAMALEEGILLRSPLFDRRLIEFAASRPLNERHGGADSKILLRRAMAGLLPEEVLKPRGRKTGTPADYFRREMLSSAQAEFRRLFGGGPSRLERMGIIDIRALREAMEGYLVTASHATGALLQMTVEAERWLASHDGVS
jgi:asparagine synthase (glutamine-hydrolysing)